MEGEVTMNYEILTGALVLIGLLAVVVKPIITLNTNITALTVSVYQLKEVIDKLETRVTAHGDEIDKINETLSDHGARITVLEKKGE